jgi:NADH dehydrogenase
VIIGGGFGGLYAAKSLRRADIRVTLVDRRNFHLFQPLLYQVATGWLSPSEIASPLRVVFERDQNIEILLGDAADIDLDRRHVVLADGDRLPYDSLVVAAGAVVNHFGHDDWAALAPGVKTIEDAIELRRRILLAFEAAERERDDPEREPWLTFVVVGGGTTGVEMAGALGELSRQILRGNFRRIDPARSRILLVQSGDRVLEDFGQELAASATRDLRRLGVTIRTRTRVVGIDPRGVDLATGGRTDRIEARTVIWAAGVRGDPIGARLAERAGLELASGGRIAVEADLTLPSHPEVHVIGDLAFVRSDGDEVPGVAPAAMQGGRFVGESIRARIDGTARPRAFRYHDRGRLATIGRGAAVAAIGRLRFDGFLAWVVWAFVHLLYLVEFENRFIVATRWAWDFFRHERGSRLITGAPLAPQLGPSGLAREGAVRAPREAAPAVLGRRAAADRHRAGSRMRFGRPTWERAGQPKGRRRAGSSDRAQVVHAQETR